VLNSRLENDLYSILDHIITLDRVTDCVPLLLTPIGRLQYLRGLSLIRSLIENPNLVRSLLPAFARYRSPTSSRTSFGPDGLAASGYESRGRAEGRADYWGPDHRVVEPKTHVIYINCAGDSRGLLPLHQAQVTSGLRNLARGLHRPR